MSDILSIKLTKFAGHFRNLVFLSDRPAVFVKTGLNNLQSIFIFIGYLHNNFMQKMNISHTFLSIFSQPKACYYTYGADQFIVHGKLLFCIYIESCITLTVEEKIGKFSTHLV